MAMQQVLKLPLYRAVILLCVYETSAPRLTSWLLLLFLVLYSVGQLLFSPADLLVIGDQRHSAAAALILLLAEGSFESDRRNCVMRPWQCWNQIHSPRYLLYNPKVILILLEMVRSSRISGMTLPKRVVPFQRYLDLGSISHEGTSWTRGVSQMEERDLCRYHERFQRGSERWRVWG